MNAILSLGSEGMKVEFGAMPEHHVDKRFAFDSVSEAIRQAANVWRNAPKWRVKRYTGKIVCSPKFAVRPRKMQRRLRMKPPSSSGAGRSVTAT